MINQYLTNIAYFLRVMAVCAFAAFLNPAVAQPYGNEWINYNQQYYRFEIFQDGIFRLPFTTIQNALQPFGVQASNIPAGNWQVWGRGEEIFLHMALGADGIFNAGDYIEFYAQRNDGWFDSGIYVSPGDQVNPLASLFTDTASYYLTWNATGNGKRMIAENNLNFQGYTPVPFVWSEKKFCYRETYLSGLRYSTGDPDITLGDPAYTGGEGWSGSKIWINQDQDRYFSLEEPYYQGPQAKIGYRVVGGSNRALENPFHHLRVTLGGTILSDSTWEYFVPANFDTSLDVNLLQPGINTLTFSNIPEPGQIAQEWASVSNLSVIYPRTLHFSGFLQASWNLPEVTGPDFFLCWLSGISLPTNDSLRVYDLTNHRIIRVIQENALQKFLVRNLPGEEHCCFISSGQIPYITDLKAVESLTAHFTDFSEPQLVQDIDYLILTHQSLLQPAYSYADYRRNEGYPNLYFPLVVDISQVYDQFGYGIQKDPLSIRNFLRYVIQHFPSTVKQLFLIGKSFQASDYRINSEKWKYTLVPGFGNPPSDNMLTFGLSQTGTFDIPVGRLSTVETDDVLNYLEKVSSYEENLKIPAGIHKNVLQFGGGTSVMEQSVFRDYLLTYDTILHNPFRGNRVISFYKTSFDPVVISQSDYIHDLLENKGVSLINYFGHASGISFDMSIGDPADFQNEDKYYFVVGNSCWAGDVFDYHGGLSSERYVLLPDRGAIGYLASVSEGEHPTLHAFTRTLFGKLSGPDYQAPIGDAIRHTISQILQDTLTDDFRYREICMEMLLHGDPALVVSPAGLPDYDLTPSVQLPQKITFSPETISTLLDTFNVIIQPVNNGKALDTMIFVRIQRIVNDIVLMDTLLRTEAPWSETTVRLSLPLDKARGAGLNKFIVTLDELHEIDEGDYEFNNTWETSVYIRSEDLIPVYPPEFAVVPDTVVSLYASTNDAFSLPADYVFQLDTTSWFTSPVMLDTLIHQGGGVLTWKVRLPVSQDSTVCFWRCARNLPSPDSIHWTGSSFQYLAGRKGWSQAHFLQMEKNGYQYVQYIKDSLKFAFVQDMKTLVSQTFMRDHAWQEEYFSVNDNILDLWSCAQNRCSNSSGIKFAVFNPINFTPWTSHDTGNGTGPFGNRHCKSYPVAAFDFCNVDSVERQKITDFIAQIPTGYYVLAMSHHSHLARQFEEPVYQAFETLGSQYIRQISDTSAYILFGKKGDPIGSALETGMASTGDSLLRIETTVETQWNTGFLCSPWIGPAKNWESIHWRIDRDLNDSVRLHVLGRTPKGRTDTLLWGISPDSTDIYQVNQLISAEEYPYLRLSLLLKDTSTAYNQPRDPAFLNRWLVLYEGIPETALDPSMTYSFHHDTLQEGDSLRLLVAFHNISEYNMDSLLVKYAVQQGEIIDTLISHRLRTHPAGDVLQDSITVPTAGLEGNHQCWVEANPYADQPEQTHLNNIGNLSFYVEKDRVDPLLDVTFDQIHLPDYDYVSPEVVIRISLYDENQHFLLTDTSLIQVWISYEEEDKSPMYYAVNQQDHLTFSPAAPGNYQCRVTCSPGLEKDGTYTLTVRAADVTGNNAGNSDYVIHFRVIHQGYRSSVYALPNPFSDFTRFVFILTGSEVPEEYSIRVYDLSGRLVKTFDRQELGSPHLGTNIAETSWDGKNENGQPLPDGVYPYEVIMKFKDQSPAASRSLESKYYDLTGKCHGKLIIMK